VTGEKICLTGEFAAQPRALSIWKQPSLSESCACRAPQAKHTHAHTQAHTYTHIHTCRHTHTHKHTHAHVHILVHTHTNTHTHTTYKYRFNPQGFSQVLWSLSRIGYQPGPAFQAAIHLHLVKSGMQVGASKAWP